VGIGKSLAEKDLAATALRIFEKAEAANCAIILPVDAVVAFQFAAHSPSHAYGLDAIPRGRHDPRCRAAIGGADPCSDRRRRDAGLERPRSARSRWRRSNRGTMVAARHAAERTKARKLISVAGGRRTTVGGAEPGPGVAGSFSYVFDGRRRVS